MCACTPRDPGNWATGLAGGAKFGYSLLFVILISNVLAMFLQHLALKLGVASGRDLAQACRDAYPRWVAAAAAAAAHSTQQQPPVCLVCRNAYLQ
jgi:manganese transport protein